MSPRTRREESLRGGELSSWAEAVAQPKLRRSFAADSEFGRPGKWPDITLYVLNKCLAPVRQAYISFV